MNASSWPMFLLRTLSRAEMAPASAFKKVMTAEQVRQPMAWSFGYGPEEKCTQIGFDQVTDLDC